MLLMTKKVGRISFSKVAYNVPTLGVRLGFWKTNVQLKTKDKYGN